MGLGSIICFVFHMLVTLAILSLIQISHQDFFDKPRPFRHSQLESKLLTSPQNKISSNEVVYPIDPFTGKLVLNGWAVYPHKIQYVSDA